MNANNNIGWWFINRWEWFMRLFNKDRPIRYRGGLARYIWEHPPVPSDDPMEEIKFKEFIDKLFQKPHTIRVGDRIPHVKT